MTDLESLHDFEKRCRTVSLAELGHLVWSATDAERRRIAERVAWDRVTRSDQPEPARREEASRA